MGLQPAPTTPPGGAALRLRPRYESLSAMAAGWKQLLPCPRRVGKLRRGRGPLSSTFLPAGAGHSDRSHAWPWPLSWSGAPFPSLDLYFPLRRMGPNLCPCQVGPNASYSQEAAFRCGGRSPWYVPCRRCHHKPRSTYQRSLGRIVHIPPCTNTFGATLHTCPRCPVGAPGSGSSGFPLGPRLDVGQVPPP